MGLRSIKRQIAKARLTAMGVGNVNRKLARKRTKDGKQDMTELPNWKKALYGKTGAEAAKAQAADGQRRKQKAEAAKSMKARKVKKVTA